MREYMITVIGSAVLAGIAQIISPERWQKYIKIVTGIMIISVIIAPIGELRGINLFEDFEYSFDVDEFSQKKAVVAELEKRVSKDVVDRIKSECSDEVKAEVKILVNDNFEIVGVEEITIWTRKNKERIRDLLNKVYSPQKISFVN